MTKKYGKLLVVALISFFISISAGYAKEMSLTAIGNEINNRHGGDATWAYIIGKYVFTSQYEDNGKSIDIQDVMLAARSINVDSSVDGKDLFNKMTIYYISLSDEGKWVKGNDNGIWLGETPFPEQFDIKYIDYDEVKPTLNTDTLINTVVGKLKSDDYKAQFNEENKSLDIEVINVDTKLTGVVGTGILSGIMEVLKNEHVTSVAFSYGGKDYEFTKDMSSDMDAVDEKFDEFLTATLKGKPYDDADLYDLVGVEGVQITIKLDGENVSQNGNIVEKYGFNVTSKAVKVEDEVSLLAALATTDVETIVLADDITVNDTINISRDVTIDGKTHAIEKDGSGSVLSVSGANVKVNNISLKGADTAIVLDSNADVTLNTVDVSGNKVGGIEVKNDETNTLNATGITNTDDAYLHPTIYVDNTDISGRKANITCAEASNVIDYNESDHKQVHYYLNEFEVANDVSTLSDIDAGSTIYLTDSITEIENVKLTNDNITIVGDGETELTGTFDVDGNNVTIDNVVVKGDGKGNPLSDGTQDKRGKYHVIEVSGTNFTLTNSTIESPTEKAFAGIYLTQPTKAIIEGNTFKTENIYHAIEFNSNIAVADGTVIKGNKFLGKQTHNHINIYRTEDNATITIEDNYFDYASSAMRISNTKVAKTTATFNIKNNTYNDATGTEKYFGFIFFQQVNVNEDYSGYTFNVSGLKGPDGAAVTAETTGKLTFACYYSSVAAENKIPENQKPIVKFS